MGGDLLKHGGEHDICGHRSVEFILLAVESPVSKSLALGSGRSAFGLGNGLALFHFHDIAELIAVSIKELDSVGHSGSLALEGTGDLRAGNGKKGARVVIELVHDQREVIVLVENVAGVNGILGSNGIVSHKPKNDR